MNERRPGWISASAAMAVYGVKVAGLEMVIRFTEAILRSGARMDSEQLAGTRARSRGRSSSAASTRKKKASSTAVEEAWRSSGKRRMPQRQTKGLAALGRGVNT